MPTGRFFKTAAEAPSGNTPKTRRREIISREARVALKARRQESSEKYRKALHEAYADNEQRIRAIASDHSKSHKRVQSDLHMAAPVSLNTHSRKSTWNAFCWKKSQDKENNGNTSLLTFNSIVIDIVVKGKKAKKSYRT